MNLAEFEVEEVLEPVYDDYSDDNEGLMLIQFKGSFWWVSEW